MSQTLIRIARSREQEGDSKLGALETTHEQFKNVENEFRSKHYSSADKRHQNAQENSHQQAPPKIRINQGQNSNFQIDNNQEK